MRFLVLMAEEGPFTRPRDDARDDAEMADRSVEVRPVVDP